MKFGTAFAVITLATALQAAPASACHALQPKTAFFHEAIPGEDVGNFVAEVEITRTFRLNSGYNRTGYEAKGLRLIRGSADIETVTIFEWVLDSCSQNPPVGTKGTLVARTVSHLEDGIVVVTAVRGARLQLPERGN